MSAPLSEQARASPQSPFFYSVISAPSRHARPAEQGALLLAVTWEPEPKEAAAKAAAAIEASELIGAGHAANRRGDARKARAHFRESGSRWCSVEPPV